MAKKWNYEQLIAAVKDSISISEILQKLGLKPKGSNYRTIHRYFNLYKIDTSHLLGFASSKGKIRPEKRKSISDMFVNNPTGSIKTERLKTRLVEENLLPYKCAECEISEWKNKELSLHLDHINGDSYDNRLENLRFLCPNCHSQTDTYCGKKNRKPQKFCACGKAINNQSVCCKICKPNTYPNPTKIDWSDMAKIVQLVKDTNYEQAARILGVSSNSIRKHIKKWV